MRKLAEVCIHRPVFATMLIMALVVVGATSYMKLGLDRFPAVDIPTVNVRTILPGASPEEVETEITQRIEEVVNTVDGIDELRSVSGAGVSNVTVTFRLDRDIEGAAQDVRDRVNTVLRNLPAGTDPPVVTKVDNDSRPVMTICLSGDKSVRELTEIADKLVKVQIERAKGVGTVGIVGGISRTINIWLDAASLASYRLPVTTVAEAIAAQNAELPGGRLTGPQVEQQLRTMGRIEDPRRFDDIVVATVNGQPIRVRDVGWSEDGTREQRSLARLNGRPSVALEVRRQTGANTVEVIAGVKRELAAVREQLPSGMTAEVIEDQSRYIVAALHEIDTHLILGSVLACLIVLAFMRSLRAVLIAGIAIPASVISTFGMMWVLGFTLNSVTMLALVLMVGIVIDDAIVVLENIFRFVEEKKMSPMQAAREGTGEIALAVLATTLSLVVIFVPVSFMSSISGRFLYQFGVTAAVAVMISLLVSFTLTPMLGARMLHTQAKGDHAASRRGFYRFIDAAYTWMLALVMRHRFATVVTAALVMASAIPLYRVLRQDYLPADVDEGEFTVNITARESTSFAAMEAAVREVEADLQKMPQLRTVLTTIGGGFLGQTSGARVFVQIAPHEQRYFSLARLWHETRAGQPLAAFRGNYTQGDVMRTVRENLRKYNARGLRIAVRNQQPFSIGTGGIADIEFIIRGPELERLAHYANTLRQRAQEGELPGIVDADVTLKFEAREVRVNVDRERAADLGIRLRDVGAALRLLVGGDEEVSRFRDPQVNDTYDVQLRLRPEDRTSPDALDRLLLPRQNSRELTELRNIAAIDTVARPARIDRLNRQRSAALRAGVGEGYALADRLALLRKAAADLDMQPGYTIIVAGRGRELERTFNEFIWAFLLSIVFMYMILASNYESFVDPLTILLSLPLSIPFAFLSLYLGGSTLNLYSALGILVLFGVVKKNAILQVDHTKQLRAHGLERLPAIMQGSRDRLRPILMTTFCLVAGMLPLALGTGPGAQERRAVAIVVIGGQTLSLLLTLLVTPVAYSLFDDLYQWLRHRLPRRQPEPIAESEAE
jgi:HAE1 family hydrophobic/amphiphilic exporter-1